MEYDNDRKINPPNKTEILYWILLGLLNPLLNSITIFGTNPRIWWVLLLVNLLVLPVYMLYANVVVSRFLFRRHYLLFIGISAGFFVFLHAFLFAVYSIILKFPLSPAEQAYFSYSSLTGIRESLWIVINMFSAGTIALIKKSFDEEEQLTNLQKDNALFKIKYLRSQLNPHFLFNTLNSIYSLSLQKSDQTPEVVVRLADIMRYLIYECNEPKVPLNKEIEFIKNYIEIEKIRYKADVRFSVEGESISGIMIEPFLFISFIENGFKHAHTNSYSNPFIYITLKVSEGEIKLTVVNNNNIDLETQAKRINGTGIRNSKSLLELLYPDAYSLDIIQTEILGEQKSGTRMKNAKERLKNLYPDTLDVILGKNSFTVSLVVKSHAL